VAVRAATLITTTIFAVSLRNGVGGRSRSDITCLGVSAVGIALWVATSSPFYSIAATAIANVGGILPTYRKARLTPESETRIAWLAGTVSSLLAAISVGRLDWSLLALPCLAVLLQGYVVYLLYIRVRRRADARVARLSV
jgi:predicted membrane metal-binding protein